MAKNNVTKVVFNSLWSMTDLSVFINGGNLTWRQPDLSFSMAFGLYKIVDGEEPRPPKPSRHSSSGIVPPAGCSDAQQRLSARRFPRGEGK